MRFRLTYEGELKASTNNNNRAEHKHDIRHVFHLQLKRLVNVHPAFLGIRHSTEEAMDKMAKQFPTAGPDPSFNEARAANAQYQSRVNQFSNFGCSFFPIATFDWSLLCSLHILFLRPDVPGGLINSGDIDNRVKTIFDALRIPRRIEELGRYQPEDIEYPLYCLL